MAKIVINPLIFQKIISEMRNRIKHSAKRSSLQINKSISLNKEKYKAPLREESTERQRPPVVFRNMAIKKRFITVDYSNCVHEPHQNKTTR